MNGRVLSDGEIQMAEKGVAVVPKAWRDDWNDLIATIRDRDKTIAELREQIPNRAGISGSFDGVTDTRKITMELREYDDLLTKIERLRGALERIANEQVDFPHREADRALAGESE